ncbi:thioredoxin [Sporomusa sphaeroides]|uniref:Thioredoxin n=2 Tax=Sporomusa TaxID=2375 RepID=A0ABM9VYI1_9FIRM|nr:thioredoxin [Sporomusa sphaeroides]OLS58061.1 thioredoxin-1 [Sporomusa sphaeroides DSM 2875]CVK17752.1 Thioredoxin-1 [Sporomusa sphaeroides DSM 2875]SCM80560.1 Thioredoxin-1 [uncultured Sporomusa sp.]
MANVVNANENNFQEEVLDTAKPVLVDFWAPWCGYCTRLAPLLDELAEEMQDQIKVAKVNVDENRSLAQKYGVMSLPTMIVFKDGDQLEKITGYMPKPNIVAKLEKII